MILSIKLGTHPGGRYRVLRLRKPPKVGQVFLILSIPTIHGEVPMGVLLREIRDVDTPDPLYVVERW